jgi:hypothetical protein
MGVDPTHDNRTAVHEGGHAIIAHLGGATVIKLTLDDPPYYGTCELAKWWVDPATDLHDSSAMTRRLVRKQAMFIRGGLAAEMLLWPTLPLHDASADAVDENLDGGENLPRCQPPAGHFADIDEACDRLLAKHRAGLIWLASELVRLRTISGASNCQTAIRQALVPF